MQSKGCYGRGMAANMQLQLMYTKAGDSSLISHCEFLYFLCPLFYHFLSYDCILSFLITKRSVKSPCPPTYDDANETQAFCPEDKAVDTCASPTNGVAVAAV